MPPTRKAKITPEHIEEARKLRAIWESTSHESQAVFGEKHEIGGQSAVGQFLRGDAPLSMKAAKGFAAGLNCDIQAFSPRLAEEATKGFSLAGIGAVRVVTDGDHPGLVPIRVVKLRLQAGMTNFVLDETPDDGDPTYVPEKLFKRLGLKQENLLALEIDGNSMEPTLFDGDTVILNTASNEPKDGRVFAVNYEGEPVVKRLHRDAGAWWLTSDNTDRQRYPHKLCQGLGCLMIGEVVYKQSSRI